MVCPSPSCAAPAGVTARSPTAAPSSTAPATADALDAAAAAADGGGARQQRTAPPLAPRGARGGGRPGTTKPAAEPPPEAAMSQERGDSARRGEAAQGAGASGSGWERERRGDDTAMDARAGGGQGGNACGARRTAEIHRLESGGDHGQLQLTASPIYDAERLNSHQ